MNAWWLLIPVLTALTGWFTVQLIFSAFLKKVLPQRRQQWTQMLGQQAAGFISFAEIGQKITGPDNVQKIMPTVEVHVDQFLRQGLPKAFPMISTFIGERTIAQLKEIFVKELETIFPVVIGEYIGQLEKDLDPASLVAEKLNSIPTSTLQKAIYEAAGADINRLKIMAAVLGLLVGAIQLAIVLITQ